MAPPILKVWRLAFTNYVHKPHPHLCGGVPLLQPPLPLAAERHLEMAFPQTEVMLA